MGVLTVAVLLAVAPAPAALAQDPDTTPPVISIVTPPEGQTYTQGTAVTAAYTCTDAASAVASCAGPVANGAAIDTSKLGTFEFTVTAKDAANNETSLVRHYSVVPVSGGPVGETPATLNLTLGPAGAFAPFIPGLGKNYSTSMTATLTTTSADATLTVADPSATATGRLVNGTYPLNAPLQVNATSPKGTGGALAPVGGAAAPTTLLTYAGPLVDEVATLNFQQAIGDGEALRTGAYTKTLTFTVSTTNP